MNHRFKNAVAVITISVLLLLLFACGKNSDGDAHSRDWPGVRMSMPRGPRPAAATALYQGSEAEEYRRYFDQRHSEGTYPNQVILGGRTIDVSSSVWNEEANISGYVILDAALASEVTTLVNRMSPSVQSRVYEGRGARSIRSGDILDQVLLSETGEIEQLSDLLEVVLIDDQNNGLTGDQRRAYYGNGIIVGRAFDEIAPLSRAQQEYLTFLQNTIIRALRSLANGQGFYTHASFVDHGLHLYSTYGNSRYHGPLFVEMMNALRDNREESFIRSMVNLGSAFSSSLAEARSGFIDAYTYLYVAKRFRSPGVRQNYLHFTLRCGGIY